LSLLSYVESLGYQVLQGYYNLQINNLDTNMWQASNKLSKALEMGFGGMSPFAIQSWWHKLHINISFVLKSLMKISYW
jgi:hypothetical protein